jgi:tRNA pseudouridine38-40 synthase
MPAATMPIERYQVILAYDGSEFQGFQRQAYAQTVQGVFEYALHKIGWQGDRVLAAGRTDAGVHAAGQVVAFDLAWKHTEQALLQAINAHLPSAVAAQSVRRVAADFHPRYSAIWRRYHYQITCQPVRNPLMERYTWRVWPAADLTLLKRCAIDLVGRHDFAAFGTPLERSSKRTPHARSSTVRTVYQANWTERLPYLVFDITANAFLYHMVRRLVHVQIMIGQGMLPPDAILTALGSPEPDGIAPQMPLIHGLAPAQGLTLVEVGYPSESLGLEDNINNTN